MEDKKNHVERNSIIINILAAFSLGIFAPVEYYFSNLDDLWYDIYNMLPIILLVFVGIFVALTIITLLIKSNINVLVIYEYLVVALSVSLYVQGNYILVPYEELNGESLNWDKYSAYNWPSVCAWVGIFVILLCVMLKKKRNSIGAFSTIMVVIAITQVISLGIIGIQNNGFKYKNDYEGSTEGKWDLSKDKNMLVLILDTMDSRVFEKCLNECLSEDEVMKLRSELDGFTYYPDTLGAFTLTDYAVPYIITGEPYLGKERYLDYINRAYEEAPLLKQLKNQNWKINVHSSTLMPQNSEDNLISNLQQIRYKCTDHLGLTKGIYKMVMFRYIPTPLKKYAYCDTSVFFNVSAVGSMGNKEYISNGSWDWGADKYWDNNIFYYEMQRTDAKCDNDVMQVYHLKGIHATRDLNKDFEVIGDSNYYLSPEGETEVVLKIVREWIKQLKQKNLYDNSIIVIMADHGTSKYETAHNYSQTPLLMIKGFDERHDMQVSDVPLAYCDLQDIYISLLKGCCGMEAVEGTIASEGLNIGDYTPYDICDRIGYVEEEYPEPVGRTRKIIFHFWEGNMGENNNGDEGIELYTDYPASFGEYFEKTGQTY